MVLWDDLVRCSGLEFKSSWWWGENLGMRWMVRMGMRMRVRVDKCVGELMLPPLNKAQGESFRTLLSRLQDIPCQRTGHIPEKESES